MSYSNYFNFGTGPSIKQQDQYVNQGNAFNSSGTGTGFYTTDYVDPGHQDQAAASRFDKLMAGHDKVSADYVKNLTDIYNGYGQYAKDFGDKAQPIIDAMTGDIGDLKGYVKDYSSTLDQIKPDMLNGLNIDPSATRTRNEYMGNVADQLNAQEQSQNINAESQGQNPYANTGSARAFALAKGSGLAGAANKAYTDWRSNYNNDMKSQQQAEATYAGMVGQKAGLQGTVLQGENSLIGANKGIMDAQIGAGQAQASGLSDLLSLNENRRQETLTLAQQSQNNARQNADITQQLQAKISPNGNMRYSANQ